MKHALCKLAPQKALRTRNSAMAIQIEFPVGLRNRTQNVSNRAIDQKKIISLLSKIPESSGGKQKTWRTLPSAGGDQSCPRLLADAIWDFQVFWKKRGVFRNIDGVVDPFMNTLAKLNELAQTGPATPVVQRVKADIVVHFRGSSSVRPLEPHEVLPIDELASLYKRMPDHPFGNRIRLHQYTGRALLRVGRTTCTIGAASTSVFHDVTRELLNFLVSMNMEPSRIYIYGSSSGGRNAIDFSARLASFGFAPHFLAPVDAAFFQTETSSRPNAVADQPETIPKFAVIDGAPRFRHNFFQSLGNHATRTLRHGIQYSSSMQNEEIHGEIIGYQNWDLKRFLNKPMTLSDDDAHGMSIGIGVKRVQRLIADDLLLSAVN
jgi:hypothetical protein